jgi:hypothetical protein
MPNPGKQAGEHEHHEPGVSEEAAVAKKLTEAAQHPGQLQRRTAPRQRLRQQQPDRKDDQQSGRRQRDEVCAPAKQGLQHTANHRCEDGRERHHHAHQRQFAAGARPGIKIAHNRPRQHDPRAGPDRLQCAGQHQHLD